MLRSNNTSAVAGENAFDDGQGLGPHLVGKQLEINGRSLSIHKQLGEGGFSFVYLVRDTGNHSDDGSSTAAAPQHVQEKKRSSSSAPPPKGSPMVLKITSVHTSAQRLMAEKEAKLLKTLSHPSIVTVYDDGFREEEDGNHTSSTSNNSHNQNNNNPNHSEYKNNRSIQHLILMEYCEGGTAFDTIKRMRASLSLSSTTSIQQQYQIKRFDLPSLIIAFGQIANAVSYLHAQRPPVIHRDLKPVNFLISRNSYKICDFGSAVLGHTDLRTPENRRKAEEIIGKTTTQMFRAPEMVDLYMAKRLTQATDVWALGCCLYSLAFLKDCFEEGSNLAILSNKYKIPEDNPYGEGIVDLIDRMLTVDYKERADMSEVIMCLSAIYSGRELPKRKRREKKKVVEQGEVVNGASAVGGGAAASSFNSGQEKVESEATPRVGAYRTDGQGIRLVEDSPISKEKKVLEAKKLNPNSAAAKRKKASETNKQKEGIVFTALSSHTTNSGGVGGKKSSASASTRSETPISDSGDFNFASFDQAFDDEGASTTAAVFDPFSTTSAEDGDEVMVELNTLMDKMNTNDDTFRFSGFDRPENSNSKTIQNQVAESSFEVIFQGFDSSVPSVFSSDDDYFSNTANDDGFGDYLGQDERTNQTVAASSSKKFFGFGSSRNAASDVTASAKKKRGVFGMLKR
ncbi:hypothetical protein ACHAXN_001449 [Cyclotella atomus]